MNSLLEAMNLQAHFRGPKILKAAEGASFSARKGETLGIVGESGCGKSVCCMSILKLLPSPPAIYAGGEIIFDGRFDILKMDKKSLRELRGGRIGMIFQEPMAALNPAYTIGQQMREAIMLHLPVTKAEAREMSSDLLAKARVPDVSRVLDSYSFSLSGGMRQRVMIAMALSCQPDLLIADEPTTALDATMQAQIIDLLERVKEETGMSVILVTHDLSLVSETADSMLVMYAGFACESAPAEELSCQPLHPYTKGLVESRPSSRVSSTRLPVIPGSVPSLAEKPPGCPFHPRCSRAKDVCRKTFPPETVFGSRKVSCWLYAGEGQT
jgi:peptide/nickel transport system ATP-binding protein/oligopeptide transport system ATP-binding protein